MVQTRRQAAAPDARPLMIAEQLPPTRRRVARDGPGSRRIPTRQRACQDRPPWPALAATDEASVPMMLREKDRRPRQRCRLHAGLEIPKQKCDGWSLEYRPALKAEHGPDFMVCVECARRNWETYGWTKGPYFIDHCLPCSRRLRAGRYPGDGQNQWIRSGIFALIVASGSASRSFEESQDSFGRSLD